MYFYRSLKAEWRLEYISVAQESYTGRKYAIVYSTPFLFPDVEIITHVITRYDLFFKQAYHLPYRANFVVHSVYVQNLHFL